jgi:hypothetical protein
VFTPVRRVVLACLTALLLITAATRAAAEGAQKVDLALESELRRGAPTHHIISVNPGCRPGAQASKNMAMPFGTSPRHRCRLRRSSYADVRRLRRTLRQVPSPLTRASTPSASGHDEDAIRDVLTSGRSFIEKHAPRHDQVAHYAALDPSVPTGSTGITLRSSTPA